MRAKVYRNFPNPRIRTETFPKSPNCFPGPIVRIRLRHHSKRVQGGSGSQGECRAWGSAFAGVRCALTALRCRAETRVRPAFAGLRSTGHYAAHVADKSAI